MNVFQKTVALVLLLTAFSLVPSAEAATIHDLTKPFEYADRLDSPTAIEYAYNLSNDFRDIRRVLVVEDNKIIFEYQRDNVDDSEVYNIWSGTKAYMGMLIGHIIESPTYNLTRNTTLGEVFADNPATWTKIENQTEIEYKKSITIYELLTMSSGITFDYFGDGFNPFDVPDWVGIDLADSMTGTYNEALRGTWNYVMASNILSYVILEVTGMTPYEYISSQIFVHIGIDPAGVKWDTNEDGVHTSLSNLRLNAKDWAKLTSLFLQKGEASPGNQVLSKEWVAESISMQTYPEPDANETTSIWHGYYWIGMPPTPGIWEDNRYCAMGFHGQASCFSYDTGRVSVVQRSNTLWDFLNWGYANQVAEITLSTSVVQFTHPPTISPAPTEVPGVLNSVPSSASRLSAWMVAVGASLVGFCLY